MSERYQPAAERMEQEDGPVEVMREQDWEQLLQRQQQKAQDEYTFLYWR